MLPHEKKTRLIAKLIEMTRVGEVRWNQGDGVRGGLGSYSSKSVFEARTDGIKFEIDKSSFGIVLKIFDSTTGMFKDSIDSSLHPILENLYQFAAGSQDNFEDKIDAFLGH